MEDYEKLYKDVLAKAREIHRNENKKRSDMEWLFPELKESENERVKKRILLSLEKDLMATKNSGCDTQDLEQCIAWLEKQGKPQDKGEISDGYHTFNELYYYRMLYNAAFFNMLPKEWVHKSKRHNDGEECFGGGWFIVMANLPTGQISNHYELKDWDLFQIPEKEVADKWDGHTPQEAADRLHKYLLEKQGEQKPVIDFKASNWYVSKVDGKIHDMTYNPTDKVEPRFKVKYAGSEYNVLEVKDIAGVTFYGIEDEPNHIDYVQADNCEIISGYAIKENGSPYPTKSAVFSEKKPAAWSEKDEKMLYTIIADFKGFKHDNTSTLESHFNECIDWLKSIKDRVQPQPKQEWSEEDENYLQSAENACEYQYGKNTSTILWLKSLKERNTWKPSKEQMEALDDALNERGFDYNDLNSLYEQLKKF